MKIKFIKEYVAFHDFEGAFEASNTYKVGTTKNVSTKSAQWLIDNGFAEKVEESVEWLHDGVSYYEPAVSGLDKKFVPWHNKYWGSAHDKARRRIGICYKSREACQRFIDFLTAVEVVSHDDGFMKYNKICCEVWELRRKYLDSEKFFTACKIDYEGFHHPGAFYFDTEEHAIASGEKHPNQWQTILNYDWSKE